MFVARPLSDAATDQFMLEYLRLSIVPQFNYTLAIVLAGLLHFRWLSLQNNSGGISRSLIVAAAASREFRAGTAGRVGLYWPQLAWVCSQSLYNSKEG